MNRLELGLALLVPAILAIVISIAVLPAYPALIVFGISFCVLLGLIIYVHRLPTPKDEVGFPQEII